MYEWFYNNSPARQEAPKGSKLVANMFKRTRTMLQPQAFLHMFKQRLMPEIDALYELHKKNPGPDLAVPLTAFTFRNREVAKRYEASSDTIKALVEKYRTGDLGLDDEDLDDEEIEEDVDDLRVFLELEKEEKAKARDTSVSSPVQYEQLTYKFR